jgi:hypothetical protein
MINAKDYSEIENNTQMFMSGYLVDDITGDGLIESSDISLVENNIGIVGSHP